MKIDLFSLFESPSKEQRSLIDLINKSSERINVFGRGTISIDPEEIHKSDKFQQDLRRASKLVSK